MTTNNCANSPKLVLKDLCKKFLGEMSCIQFFTHLTCFVNQIYFWPKLAHVLGWLSLYICMWLEYCDGK